MASTETQSNDTPPPTPKGKTAAKKTTKAPARSANTDKGKDKDTDRGAAHRDSWVVRRYLATISGPTKRRNVNPEQIKERLATVEASLADNPSNIERLALIQTRIDLTQALEAADNAEDAAEIEDSFVAVAARYSERKGISWTAWREIGVPAAVLKRGGVPRS